MKISNVYFLRHTHTLLISSILEIPHNVLVVDTASYERALYSGGYRGIMLDPKTNKSRTHGSTLSLENMLRSFTTSPLTPPAPSTPAAPDSAPASGSPPAPQTPIVLPNITMHNAGNDAFMALFALQMLLDPTHTQVPTVKKGRIGRQGLMSSMHPMMAPSPSIGMGMGLQGTPIPVVGSYGMQIVSSPYDLADEFGQMKMERSRSPTLLVSGQGPVGVGGSQGGKQGSNTLKMMNGGGSGRRH